LSNLGDDIRHESDEDRPNGNGLLKRSISKVIKLISSYRRKGWRNMRMKVEVEECRRTVSGD